MWKWVLSKIILSVFIASSAYSNSPQWGSFEPNYIAFDQKILFGEVTFSNGPKRLIYIVNMKDSNVLSWGMAQKNDSNYEALDISSSDIITPFELMYIRDSTRNRRLEFDIIVGRNISNPQQIELNEAYKNNAKFYAHAEHFLLSYLYPHIEHYINHTLGQRYGNLIQKTKIGTSYENRDIYAYKASCKNSSPDINLIWISLEHARERTTVMANLYAMKDFLQQLSLNPSTYCDTAVWFIPILNPDGFVYANTHDEMWRKNRRPVSNKTKDGDLIEGIGVDIARNFFDSDCPQDFRFSEDLTYPDDDQESHSGEQTSSTFSDDPNSIIYRGNIKSEAETLALIQMVNSQKSGFFNSIITLHSAHKNGGIFHLEDQEPISLANYIYAAIDGNAELYQAHDIRTIYNHPIPGIPELYMHNRGIPMLTVEFQTNESTICYNKFDPPIEQYTKDQKVAEIMLRANIHYWQEQLKK